MNDALIVLGVAEAILFLASFGLLFGFGANEIGTKRKKIGITLFILWVVVLAVCVTWVIILKSS